MVGKHVVLKYGQNAWSSNCNVTLAFSTWVHRQRLFKGHQFQILNLNLKGLFPAINLPGNTLMVQVFVDSPYHFYFSNYSPPSKFLKSTPFTHLKAMYGISLSNPRLSKDVKTPEAPNTERFLNPGAEDFNG